MISPFAQLPVAARGRTWPAGKLVTCVCTEAAVPERSRVPTFMPRARLSQDFARIAPPLTHAARGGCMLATSDSSTWRYRLGDISHAQASARRGYGGPRCTDAASATGHGSCPASSPSSESRPAVPPVAGVRDRRSAALIGNGHRGPRHRRTAYAAMRLCDPWRRRHRDHRPPCTPARRAPRWWAQGELAPIRCYAIPELRCHLPDPVRSSIGPRWAHPAHARTTPCAPPPATPCASGASLVVVNHRSGCRAR